MVSYLKEEHKTITRMLRKVVGPKRDMELSYSMEFYDLYMTHMLTIVQRCNLDGDCII